MKSIIKCGVELLVHSQMSTTQHTENIYVSTVYKASQVKYLIKLKHTISYSFVFCLLGLTLSDNQQGFGDKRRPCLHAMAMGAHNRADRQFEKLNYS